MELLAAYLNTASNTTTESGFNASAGGWLAPEESSPEVNATPTANGTKPDIPEIFKLSRSLMFFSLSPIIPLGLICNTISIVVFMNRCLRNRAASWYLAALAVSDDISLLSIMLDYWLKDPRIGFTTITTSHALCVLVTHFSYSSRLMSALLVTSFTIERFIGVVHPLKRASLSTTNHARRVILAEAILCLVVTSFTIFTIGIVETPYGHDCDVIKDRAKIYLGFNITFLIMGSIVVPILIICSLNMYILHKIYQRKRYFVPMNLRFNGQRQVSYKSHKDYNIAKLLLVVSSVFVALNIPYCICWFILCFHYFKLIGPFGPGVEWQLYAAKYITSVPYYLNYGINFALYNLCARAFRTQLVRLIKGKACGGNKEQPRPPYIPEIVPSRHPASKDHISILSRREGGQRRKTYCDIRDSKSMYELLRGSNSGNRTSSDVPITM